MITNRLNRYSFVVVPATTTAPVDVVDEDATTIDDDWNYDCDDDDWDG